MDIVTFAVLLKLIKAVTSGIQGITQVDNQLVFECADGTKIPITITPLMTPAEKAKLASMDANLLNRFSIDTDTGTLLFNGDEVGGGATLEKDIPSGVSMGMVNVGTKLTKGTTFTEVIEKLLTVENPPKVTLTASSISDAQSVSAIREKGVGIDVSYKAIITKGTHNVVSVNWTGGIVASETTTTGTFTRSITGMKDTTTVTVTAKDTVNKSVSAKVTFTFVNPIYVGKVSKDITIDTITEDDIFAGDKLLRTKGTNNFNITTSLERIFIAYPSSYGALAKIVETSTNQNIIDVYKSKDISTINPSTGIAETYTVYLANVENVVDDMNFTYSW